MTTGAPAAASAAARPAPGADRAEVLAALPTMFTADGELDLPANRRLHAMLRPLLDGVLVAGTTGEFPALADHERGTLVELALDVWGPERVVAHVGAPATSQAVTLAARARELGAGRLACLPPYYFAVDAVDIEAHWRAVRTAGDPVELYAYLFPDRTNVTVSPRLLARLCTQGVIQGAKVSGTAADELERYLAALPAGVPVWSGSDVAFADVVRAGGRGVVSGLSAAAPWVFASLRSALREARSVTEPLAQAQRVAAALGGSPAGIKLALAELGVGEAFCRMRQGPSARVDPVAVTQLVRRLQRRG